MVTNPAWQLYTLLFFFRRIESQIIFESIDNSRRKSKDLEKITSLNHKILNDPVELAPLVPNWQSSFSANSQIQFLQYTQKKKKQKKKPIVPKKKKN